MKSPHSSKIHSTIFKQELEEQTVRVIKAAQAGKILNGTVNSHVHSAAETHKKPEIRMIHAGTEYCDLEVVCGCGESTQVRCWNAPPVAA